MVFVWSYLTKGDANYTLVQVSVNDLILLIAFIPNRTLVAGHHRYSYSWDVLAASVVTFVVIPLIFGYLSNRLLLRFKGKEWFKEVFLQIETGVHHRPAHDTCIAVRFSGRYHSEQTGGHSADRHTTHPPDLFHFFLTWFAGRFLKLRHAVCAPAAMIGASNFFELAVAVAISLFGLNSGASLATVVGVLLIEVPVMLSLVAMAINGDIKSTHEDRLFSDIHANLPALEAVLADIDAQQPDAIFAWAIWWAIMSGRMKCASSIRERNIPTIAGNYDDGVGRNSDDCGCAYKTDEEKANGAKVHRLYQPDHHRKNRNSWTNYPVRSGCLSVKIMPGSICCSCMGVRDASTNTSLKTTDKSLVHIMEEAEADILCFGHTHKPWHRTLTGRDGQTLHAINIGSVGKPKDGDPRACYVFLEIDEDGLGEVQFRRVAYDVEGSAAAVEASDLPQAFADALRTAR